MNWCSYVNLIDRSRSSIITVEHFLERGTTNYVILILLYYYGSIGREAQGFMKKITERMEVTSGQRYSDCMGFMRKRLRFELLKTTLILHSSDGLRATEVE